MQKTQMRLSGFLLFALCAISWPVWAQNANPSPPPASAPIAGHVQVIQPGPLQINPNPSPNIGPVLVAPGAPSSVTVSSGAASLVCSDPALLDKCGFEKADRLGTYVLNMKCDNGFYDPIWGGTCWKCPEGLIRASNNIQKSDACWSVPSESFAPAQRVKNTAWAWECPSGSFWDGYDGGACWQCPASEPRRTAYAVRDTKACASKLNETAPAMLLKFSGCPSVQQAVDDKTLTLRGKRLPGRPFLDIGTGLCYACPSVDEAGNFLVTERTLNAVTSDQACVVRFKYRPQPLVEPGLAQLGAAAIIAEQRILDPARFTAELYLLASAYKVEDAKAWVAAQWQAIAASPYQNQALQTAVYVELVAAASTAPNARTPAQAKIVANMERYIQDKKTFVAKTALDMYDTWKRIDDEQRLHRAPNAGVLFDYGTVPLDFNDMAASVLAPGNSLSVTGLGAVLAALPAASAFKNVAQLAPITATAPGGEVVIVTGASALFKHLSAGQFFANVAEGVAGASSVLAGATAINIASAVLTSVAIDQFISIIQARPRLEAALAQAQQPVNLQTLVSSGDGQDLLKWYYAKAVQDGPQVAEPEVVTLAQAGNAAAAKTGYAAPQ